MEIKRSITKISNGIYCKCIAIKETYTFNKLLLVEQHFVLPGKLCKKFFTSINCASQAIVQFEAMNKISEPYQSYWSSFKWRKLFFIIISSAINGENWHVPKMWTFRRCRKAFEKFFCTYILIEEKYTFDKFLFQYLHSVLSK